MSQVIKAFMGVFFLVLLLFLGTGIISAQIDAANAIDYKSDLVAELENSNYNAQVMNGCIRQSLDKGYGITIQTYSAGGGVKSYQTPDVTDTSDVVMAEVVLTYPYRIAFLNSMTNHQIRGFAR